ncbi:MAG: hypothetical protein C4547_15115 [Phycisphaerales bacterium]|nr:MAG: hypothetical protein C4547_15115 [Phycisphaerales bacterium]
MSDVLGGGPAPASAAGNYCWYSQEIVKSGRRCECELTDHDCEPDLELPCETEFDCDEGFRRFGNCDFKKGCIAESQLCGCGPAEPSACCLADLSCEDLPFLECQARGGDSHGGQLCGDFTCPAPAACCVNDRKCVEMTEMQCARADGAWGGGLACQDEPCPCHDVRKVTGRCRKDGTVQAIVKFRNDEWDGRTIAVDVDGELWFELEVHGHIARRSVCCFDGKVSLTLKNPSCRSKTAVVECL